MWSVDGGKRCAYSIENDIGRFYSFGGKKGLSPNNLALLAIICLTIAGIYLLEKCTGLD